MTITIYSAGEKAEALKHMANWAGNTKLSNERAIANGAVELDSGSQKIIDIFSATAGANSTVDTVNSDWIRSSSGILEPSFETITNWTYSETGSAFNGGQSTSHVTDGTYSYKLGFNGAVNVGNYGQISQTVDFTSISELNFDYYIESTGTNTELNVLLGSVEIFSTTGSVGQSGSPNIDVSSYSGSQILRFRYASAGNVTDNINVYVDNVSTNNSYFQCKAGSGVDYADSTGQSTTATIPTTDDYIFVTPYLAEELGDDALTFDYSMDNESTWNTGNAINTWIDASGVTNSGTMSVKLQLDTGDGSTSPQVKGWAVLTE